jgi:sirohydrochlorin cobaltochelatase
LAATTPDDRKDAVLLIAHGSREAVANREVIEMANRLAEKLPGVAIIPCFLEIATPSIPAGFAMAVERGCNHITAVPFFLATGAHVGADIPRILEECRSAHSGVEVEITAAAGPDPGLDEIALRRIEQAISSAVKDPGPFLR